MQAYGKEEGAFARAWNVVKAPFLIWNSCLASLREGGREGVGLQTATGRLARAPTQLAQRRLWFWRGPKKARYAAFAPKMRNHIIIWMQTERAHSSTKPPPPGPKYFSAGGCQLAEQCVRYKQGFVFMAIEKRRDGGGLAPPHPFLFPACMHAYAGRTVVYIHTLRTLG